MKLYIVISEHLGYGKLIKNFNIKKQNVWMRKWLLLCFKMLNEKIAFINNWNFYVK